MRPIFCIWQRSVPWCWEDRDHWPSIGFLFEITIAVLASHRVVHLSSKTCRPIDRISCQARRWKVADLRSASFRQKSVAKMLPLWAWSTRSEEHTSELQSLRHLVCRLLLE